mgnify:CR=1 FL=1
MAALTVCVCCCCVRVGFWLCVLEPGLPRLWLFVCALAERLKCVL